MKLLQLLSKILPIREYRQIDGKFIQVEITDNKNNIVFNLNVSELGVWKHIGSFELEEKECFTLPTETLEQFKLKKKQAADRLQKMEQGDQIAFEEEFVALINMKIRAKCRYAGDEIYQRIGLVLPLAEKFNKEFAQKFRALS